jgi:hypothetical protein
MRRKRWALVAAALASPTGVAAAVTTPPAHASCVSASAWVDREHAPTTYLVGPGYCVTPTPWTTAVEADKDQQVGGFGPPGSPSGAGAQVWVPAP